MPNLKDNPKVQELIKQPSHPSLEQIVELAREEGAKTAPQLWAIFDEVRKLWIEEKSYEGDWDPP